jgi:lysophospholipase L1-like esterase
MSPRAAGCAASLRRTLGPALGAATRPTLWLIFWTALAPPLAAQFNIACFGDSITEADPEFGIDETADPNDPPEEWGYPRRLDDMFGTCGTSSCNTYNRGKGGEETPEGLTRLQNVVLPERRWDLVILMDGTNDIFQHTSTVTIQTNLRLMDQRATEAGADTLHASIIHFHPNAVVARPWANTDAFTLRGNIMTIATERKRYLSDQFNVLCPTGNDVHGHNQTDCFSMHYGEKDLVGHPNGSGFDMMTPVFYSTITSVAVPGTPTTVSPSGASCGAPTTFTWNKESPARANWYNLLIETSGGTDLSDKWYQETEWRGGQPNPCHGSSPCSVPTPIALGPGNYRWSVRGRNPQGHGSFTSTRSFSFATTPPAVVTTLTSPAGNTANNDPTFTWGSVSGATGYDLSVETAGGSPVADVPYTSSICGGGSCSANPPGTLSAGDYRWRVRSSNPCQADWSAYQTFHVWGSVGATTPKTPVDGSEIVLDEPGFYWQAASEADAYEIELAVDGGGGLVLSPAPPYTAGSACTDSSCSVSSASPTLSPGLYTWRVRGSNPGDTGPFSSLNHFTVLACDASDPVTLENETVTTAQEILACTHLEAGNQGSGNYAVGATGVLTLHVGLSATFFEGFSVATGGTLTVQTDRP